MGWSHTLSALPGFGVRIAMMSKGEDIMMEDFMRGFQCCGAVQLNFVRRV